MTVDCETYNEMGKSALQHSGQDLFFNFIKFLRMKVTFIYLKTANKYTNIYTDPFKKLSYIKQLWWFTI